MNRSTTERVLATMAAITFEHPAETDRNILFIIGVRALHFAM
jgi:hypothetical protein